MSKSLNKTFSKYSARIVTYAVRRGLLPIIGIMSLLAVGLIYVGYSYFISPIEADTAERQAVIAKIENENRVNAEVERSEPQFKAEFRKAVELFKSAQPLVPNNSEVSNVLAQVQLAAQKNGVTLTGFSALKNETPSATANKFYERSIPAFAVGTHAQIRSFFQDVARLPRIVLITEFDEVSLRQKVQVAFTLVPYNAPPPSEIPALPPDLAALLAETTPAK